jgi:chromosome segregation ATPase
MLMRRLELVGQACQINAQLQRLQQAQAGLDFEMQRCELALEAGVDVEEAAAAMIQAESAAHKIRRERIKLELEMEEVEAEIKEIDGFFDGLPKNS